MSYHSAQLKKRFWRNPGIAALVFFGLVAACEPTQAQYGLPVKLDSTTAQVRSALGAPNESFNTPNNPAVRLEWYYRHGIVGGFEHDKLSSLTLYKDTVYLGFMPYVGAILNGVTLSDDRKMVL